jgi:ribosomal protein L29
VDWHISLELVWQFMSLVFMGGAAWMKLRELEKDLTELKKEVVDFRELKSDLAVVKTQLNAIHDTLKLSLRKIDDANSA